MPRNSQDLGPAKRTEKWKAVTKKQDQRKKNGSVSYIPEGSAHPPQVSQPFRYGNKNKSRKRMKRKDTASNERGKSEW